MSQILKCLVVSEDQTALNLLKEVMKNNWDTYTPQFKSCAPANIATALEGADLVLIDNKQNIPETAMAELIAKAKGMPCIVLQDSTQNRKILMASGADEVLSMKDLLSDAGIHLIEKIMVMKHLAAAEARAEQSEERFRDIIEHSHDMIILLDADGYIVYVSQAFERQMNYQSWEVLGQPIFAFMHAEDLTEIHSHFKDIVHGRKKASPGASMEFRLRHHDGQWKYLEARVSNLLNNKNVEAVVLNARDVSAQKKAERELEKYRQHLEVAIEKRTKEVEAANRRVDTFLAASPDTLIAIDKDGYISYASQHYRHRYPRDAATFAPGMHILDAFEVIARNIPMTPDDPRYNEMRAWWGNPYGTREFRQAGGMWTRLQAKRMEGTEEIVISTTDITDYKRQQAQLAAQSSELKASLMNEREIVEQQKTFISMVSHEFRTPLSIIDGNAQIILSRGMKLPKEMLERRAITIRSAVERLIRLIETILSSHMMETGKITMDPGPCNLSELIRNVAGDQQDLSPNHNIHVNLQPGLPIMTLDEKLMRQILTNLLSNAVKYAPKQPDITVKAFEDERFVQIEVTDRGVGIPEEEQGKIFSKYFRASTSGGIPGSGLGLTLVKQFVEMHDGTISLKSQVDAGTTMTVRIPIVPAISLE